MFLSSNIGYTDQTIVYLFVTEPEKKIGSVKIKRKDSLFLT